MESLRQKYRLHRDTRATLGLGDKDVIQIVYQIDQKVRDLKPGEVVRPLPAEGY